MQKIRSRRPTRTLRKGEIMDKEKKNWMMVAWTAIEKNRTCCCSSPCSCWAQEIVPHLVGQRFNRRFFRTEPKPPEDHPQATGSMLCVAFHVHCTPCAEWSV